jgi:hypothetical protein
MAATAEYKKEEKGFIAEGHRDAEDTEKRMLKSVLRRRLLAGTEASGFPKVFAWHGIIAKRHK